MDSSRDRVWTAIHVVTLIVGAAVLILIGRAMWWIIDDWQLLITYDEPILHILEPYYRQLYAVTQLLFRGLAATTGISTYTPFIAALVAAHVLVVHLAWRLMRKVRIDIGVATILAAVLMFFGGGTTALLQSGHIHFMVPISVGYAALIAYLGTSTTQRVALLDVAVAAGLSLAVFAGTTTLGVIAMVGVFLLMRRRVVAAAIVVAVPLVVFATWFLLTAHLREPPESLTTGFALAVENTWVTLTSTFNAMTHLRVLAIAALAALGIYMVRRVDVRDPRWQVAISTCTAAAVFLGLLAIFRTYGETTTHGLAGRYTYMLVLFLVPVIAIAAQELFDRHRFAIAALTTLAVLATLSGGRLYHGEATALLAASATARGVFMAHVELARQGYEPIGTGLNAALDAIGLTPAVLDRMMDDLRLPDYEPNEDDRLNALAASAFLVSKTVSVTTPPRISFPESTRYRPDKTTGCYAIVGTDLYHSEVNVTFDRGSALPIITSDPVELRVRLEPDRPKPHWAHLFAPAGRSHLVADIDADIPVNVQFKTEETVRICGHL